MLSNTDLIALKEKVEEEFNSHDHSSATFQTSDVPWTHFDKFSIYTLGVRKYKLFNQSPRYGAMITCGGATSDNFATFEEAIEWCYSEAAKQLEELDKKIEEHR